MKKIMIALITLSSVSSAFAASLACERSIDLVIEKTSSYLNVTTHYVPSVSDNAEKVGEIQEAMEKAIEEAKSVCKWLGLWTEFEFWIK